jgi:hypothetical protein
MFRVPAVWRIVFSLVLLLSIGSSPAFGQAPSGTEDSIAPTGEAGLAVKEIRSIVPFGKADGHFGVVAETPVDKFFPPSTPIVVRLLTNAAPAPGEPMIVTLQVHAYQNVPATTASIEVPANAEMLYGVSQAQLDLAAGETREITARLAFKQEGEYAIVGRALATVSPDMVYGDMDALYFTVGAKESFEGWDSANQLELAAGQAPAEAPALAESVALEIPEELAVAAPEESEEALSKDDGGLAAPDRPGPAPEAQEKPGAAAPEANVNVSICWRLGSDRDGSQPRLRDARIELFDDDAGADDLLATGFTSYSDGCRTFTVNNADGDEGGTIDVYFRVSLYRSGRYRVTNYGNGIYNCQTSTHNNTAANYDFGLWWCGGGAGNDRSVRIFNDLYRASRFVREQATNGGMGGNPGEVWVLWQTGGNDGTYYSLGDQKVHLKDADAASRDTVVHEANHSYMHDIYAAWPPFDCPSPHFINGISGKGCALSEGWTYMIVAAADGNPVYTWPSGATLNLETPTCSSASWDDGGRVEGRVGGVLIDLIDPFTLSFGSVAGFSNEAAVAACGGEDQTSGMFDAVWDLFYDQDDAVFVTLDGNTNSYSNAWEARQYPRYGPEKIGNLNSISTFMQD